jgi:dienelactone hydrolase
MTDIFGFQNPTQQGADILASTLGARVAMPDIFKGAPWDLSNFPPPDKDAFLAWIGTNNWAKVEAILIKTIAFLKQDGAKKFGVYGFCWGAKMACLSTQLVGPAGIVHPAFLQLSDAEKVVAPICLLDSKDEDKAAMEEFIAVLKKKPFGDKVRHKRYDDMFHGFCAGRANYGDELNGKRAREVPP